MSGNYSTPRWRKLRAVVIATGRHRGSPCHRCKQPINYSLRHPDDGSAQVDHVLPGSTHPHLFYRLDNLRLIHKSCNEARRAEPIDDNWTRPTW